MKRGARLPGSAIQKPRAGWRSKNSKVEAVLYELHKRQLGTLDDCREVWERGLDPFALFTAVALSPLPAWLKRGLLVLLEPRHEKIAGFLGRRRRQSEADRMAALRAWELSKTHALATRRRQRPTWAGSTETAAGRLAGTNAVGSAGAVEQSYVRIARALNRNPVSFWSAGEAVEKQHNEAVIELLRLFDAWAARQSLKPAARRKVAPTK